MTRLFATWSHSAIAAVAAFAVAGTMIAAAVPLTPIA